MSGPYSPTARLGASPALPDGDAKNVATARNERDARAYFSDLLLGALDWTGDFGVRSGGALNAFTLDVGAIAAVAVRDADDVLWPHAYGGGTINQTKIEGGGGTLGAVERWWNVYAFRTGGGSLDFEISQTAPNATRRYKSTDNTRRFVGCFPTDGTGAPIALWTSMGRTVYLAPQLNVFQNASLAGAATEYVTLATRVPPHARLADVLVTMTGTGSYFRAIGDAGGDTATPVDSREVVLDTSQRAQWGVPLGQTGSIAVGVRGWRG